MQKRRYLVLICAGCGSRNVIRQDRAKDFEHKNYFCRSCNDKNRKNENGKVFLASLGEAANLIKDTCIDNTHRYVLVDCALCSEPYWARFDNWEAGYQKCWNCTHANIEMHGKSGSPLYKRWRGIKTRTISDEPAKRRVYKERGIKVCDEWQKSFLAFEKWSLENGYQKGLVLDRIDNYKGYSPENCRWVTLKESTANRRKFTYV